MIHVVCMSHSWHKKMPKHKKFISIYYALMKLCMWKSRIMTAGNCRKEIYYESIKYTLHWGERVVIARTHTLTELILLHQIHVDVCVPYAIAAGRAGWHGGAFGQKPTGEHLSSSSSSSKIINNFGGDTQFSTATAMYAHGRQRTHSELPGWGIKDLRRALQEHSLYKYECFILAMNYSPEINIVECEAACFGLNVW